MLRHIDISQGLAGGQFVLYRRLADLIVVIHLLVSAFALAGVFLVMRHRWLAILHVPLVAWVTTAFIRGWTCPLTPLEKHLRRLSGGQVYEGGFIAHYVLRRRTVSKPEAHATRRADVAIGVVTGTLNLLLYAVGVLNAV